MIEPRAMAIGAIIKLETLELQSDQRKFAVGAMYHSGRFFVAA